MMTAGQATLPSPRLNIQSEKFISNIVLATYKLSDDPFAIAVPSPAS
jgi:hypothetical protein